MSRKNIDKVAIGLSAVIGAAGNDELHLLVARHAGDHIGLPSGAFDPALHRTLEQGLRVWVRAQTGFDLGYVEQLYTFGDIGRDLPQAALADVPQGSRLISVGYLGLAPELSPVDDFEALWHPYYRYFPWEDHRFGVPDVLGEEIIPALMRWAGNSEERQFRTKTTFATNNGQWREERVLERYELMYEAGLVDEACRDRHETKNAGIATGAAMISDHRRILATALGRLRAKLQYRPIIFELMPEHFTLSSLQKLVEFISGRCLHTQNFRRALSRSGLVRSSGRFMTETGGRPAKLFCRCSDDDSTVLRGIATPFLR